MHRLFHGPRRRRVSDVFKLLYFKKNSRLSHAKPGAPICAVGPISPLTGKTLPLIFFLFDAAVPIAFAMISAFLACLSPGSGLDPFLRRNVFGRKWAGSFAVWKLAPTSASRYPRSLSARNPLLTCHFPYHSSTNAREYYLSEINPAAQSEWLCVVTTLCLIPE